jgi:hypothetical protein
MNPTQLLKEIRRVPNLSRTQKVILAQLTEAERLGRLTQAEPLLRQLHRELFPEEQARPQMMTPGMRRAWAYAQLTHPDKFSDEKQRAISIARRLEYDEQTPDDMNWIAQKFGARI